MSGHRMNFDEYIKKLSRRDNNILIRNFRRLELDIAYLKKTICQV